jgi:hypothetical protein
MDDAPRQAQEMARNARGLILRWREHEGQMIVLLTDGRKLYEPIGKSKPILHSVTNVGAAREPRKTPAKPKDEPTE